MKKDEVLRYECKNCGFKGAGIGLMMDEITCPVCFEKIDLAKFRKAQSKSKEVKSK